MSRQIKMLVCTGWANGDHVDYMDLPQGWDNWTEKERDSFLNDVAIDHLHNTCETNAWVEDEDE